MPSLVKWVGGSDRLFERCRAITQLQHWLPLFHHQRCAIRDKHPHRRAACTGSRLPPESPPSDRILSLWATSIASRYQPATVIANRTQIRVNPWTPGTSLPFPSAPLAFALSTTALCSPCSFLPYPHPTWGTKQKQKTEYKDAFALFDKHGTGAVPCETLGDLLRALGQNPTQAEVAEIVSSAPRDVDYKTFLTILNRPDGFKPAGTPATDPPFLPWTFSDRTIKRPQSINRPAWIDSMERRRCMRPQPALSRPFSIDLARLFKRNQTTIPTRSLANRGVHPWIPGVRQGRKRVHRCWRASLRPHPAR